MFQIGPPLDRSLPDGCSFDEVTGTVHCTDDLSGEATFEWIEKKIGHKALLRTKVRGYDVYHLICSILLDINAIIITLAAIYLHTMLPSFRFI